MMIDYCCIVDIVNDSKNYIGNNNKNNVSNDMIMITY